MYGMFSSATQIGVNIKLEFDYLQQYYGSFKVYKFSQFQE